MPTVAPITGEIVERARDILNDHDSITARDALHAAACRSVGAEAICSYDRDFDLIEGIRRIEPEAGGENQGGET